MSILQLSFLLFGVLISEFTVVLLLGNFVAMRLFNKTPLFLEFMTGKTESRYN